MNSAVTGILAGYVCGSLLPGYWIGKYAFGKDLRAEGSGNIGATNAFRVLGPVVGSIVLLLDVAKGAGAVWIACRIGGHATIAGLGAILGHVFSPFLRFRGGKGVATGLGVFLMLALKPTLIAFAAFAAALLVTRRVSPASCLSAVVMGGALPLLSRDVALIAVGETVVALILVRHRSNIRRLVRGEEPPVF